MDQNHLHTIKLSVRNLVEFILRGGDINSSSVGAKDMEAMQKGSKLHRKIQRSMGSNYSPEVALSITVPIAYQGSEFELVIEGRADGIIHLKDSKDREQYRATEETPEIVIDEIKGIYADVGRLEAPFTVHVAQAKCYAYIYAKQHNMGRIGIRMTYCNLDTEVTRYFDENYDYKQLEQWFEHLIHEYAKWADMELKWKKLRNESIKQLQFPFDYRSGQKKLVTGVYQTILRNRKLYIEAPTGVGKTISTVFPSVKAMGEGLIDKIFYLTAKTITRTVAEETFRILKANGAKLKVVTITAKDKICVCDKVNCTPDECDRAKGHFDRVNDAIYDLLTTEDDISRELVEQYATKHNVCPFEMCLDVTLWADSVICDYNYVFDPNVYLRRFFGTEKKQDCVFLIDEAHNLVERAREMYSAILVKEHFLEAKHLVQGRSKAMEKRLDACNKDLLQLKREHDGMSVIKNVDSFVLHLMRLQAEYDEFLQEHQSFDGREQVLQLYFDVRHFMNIYTLLDEKYTIYVDYNDQKEFLVKLQCMDPSNNLTECISKGKSAVFFSATLLPIRYYKEQLAGKEEDYAIYADSPFEQHKRALLIANDVSTVYAKRNQYEYEKIARYIHIFTKAKTGNYMVFFPSYQYMQQIYDCIGRMDESKELIDSIMLQNNRMTEYEKEAFLGQFVPNPEKTLIAFCVMGGIFSEGIDLKTDRLIGAVIVGTGLPMVCNEKELFRTYYQEKKGAGFEYAYLYQGMNKVLQSAGRVIRTIEDVGAILLLDQRFLMESYQGLFPKEWYPYQIVNQNLIEEEIKKFWRTTEENQGEEK